MMPSIAGLNKLFQAAITYLLRTDFSAVTGQPVTLTNGQVLDTVGEGMVTGSLTVVETGTGTTQIVSNKLQLDGDSNWEKTEIISQSFSPADGRIIKIGVTPATTNEYGMILSLATSNAVGYNNHVAEIYYVNSGFVAFTNRVTGESHSNLTQYTAADDNYCIVINNTGNRAFLFRKVSGTWQFLDILTATFGATLYAKSASYNQQFDISSIKVTNTLYPNLVQTVAEDDFSDANGTALSGKALDKGGNWNVALYPDAGVTGAFSVQSGKATAIISSGTGAYAGVAETPNLGYSDVLVTANVITQGQYGDSSPCGVYARLNGIAESSRDYVLGLINSSNGGQSHAVWECTAGAVTTRASSTVPVGNSVSVNAQLRVIGSSVTFGTGLATLLATLAAPTTHQKCALLLYDNTSGVTTGAQFDNFKVYPATGYDTVLDAI